MNIQRNKERIREIQQITGLQPTHFADLSLRCWLSVSSGMIVNTCGIKDGPR